MGSGWSFGFPALNSPISSRMGKLVKAWLKEGLNSVRGVLELYLDTL